MIRRCELTEVATRLTLQLEAYCIPDDFDAAGDDAAVVLRIRDEYTNYRQLASALPACPDNCPPGRNTEASAGHCLTYEFAHHMLKTEAKQVALQAYNAWRAPRKSNKVQPLKKGITRL